MLTPEIKTNLILKEIGIKRYSLRTNSDQSLQKKLHLYQKGNILALLENPFSDFNDQYKYLLRAIISSTNLDKGKEINKTITYCSNNELVEEIKDFEKLKLIIFFGKNSFEYNLDCPFIKVPSLNNLANDKNLKKNLWLDIKQNLKID
jgi:DNA polymerase III psi subunit